MMQPVIRKNHMDIAWHEYTDENGADIPVTQASLTEKASIIGRVGITCRGYGNYLHGRYRPDVYRVYMF